MQQALSEKKRLFREWQRTREVNDQKRYKEASKQMMQKGCTHSSRECIQSAVGGVERKGMANKYPQASQCQEKNSNGHWKSNSRER